MGSHSNLPQSQQSAASNVQKYEPRSTNGDMMQNQAKVTAPPQQQPTTQQQPTLPTTQQQASQQQTSLPLPPSKPKEFSFEMAVSKTMVQKAKQEEVAAPVPKKEPETPTKPALVPNHQIPPGGDIKSDDIKTDLKSLRPLASKTNHVLKDPQK